MSPLTEQLDLDLPAGRLTLEQTLQLIDRLTGDLAALADRSPRSHAPGIRAARAHLRAAILIDYHTRWGASP